MGDPSQPTGPPASLARRIGASLAISAVVAVGLGGTVILAALRKPAGPAGRPGLTGRVFPASRPISGLRVGFYNIHRGVGRDGLLDLQRVAADLAGLDVVGLSEVDAANPLDANQAQTLGEKLAMGWLFAPTEVRWGVGHFGNALLAGPTVGRWTRTVLPSAEGRSWRNLLTAEMNYAGRNLTVAVTHLDLRYDRALQLQALFAHLATLEGPLILVADLNTPEGDPALAAHAKALDLVDALAGRGDPRRAGDWILVRGLTVGEAGLVESGASDHALLWAELAWPAGESGPR